jgi:trk system potassium uptake protein TrkA
VKIVIIGAGAVGYDLAQKISQREHDVYVVERDARRLQEVQEGLDCHFLAGNAVDPALLTRIGLSDCDLFAAVTNRDEVNIIACLTAHKLGARTKVARVREEDYYRGGRLFLDGINVAINPDHEAVNTIREILFQTAATDVFEFADGLVRVVGSKVDEQSPLAGRSLAQINRDTAGRLALVITIVRGEETLIPRGDTVIQPADRVYLAGERHLVDRSLHYVQEQADPLEKVLIVGASPLGIDLARELTEAGVRVKLVERNEEKVRWVSENLHHVLSLKGDGTDVGLLEEEGIEEMDGFVAVTNDEESNVMACLLARHRGARKTVCLVNRPDYVPLLPLLGIDAAVSPRISTAARIARFVKRGGVVSAQNVGFTGAEILQFKIGPRWPHLGRPLAKLPFPRHAVLGAVLKGSKVVTPRGDTQLAAGDEVVCFALPEGVSELEAFFAKA